MTFNLFNDAPWVEHALCANAEGDKFYPDQGSPTRDAKRVCMRCPVRGEKLGGTGECLEYALDHDERFGVWGGYSERERRQMKRDRRWGAA